MDTQCGLFTRPMDKWADSPDKWKYLIFGGNLSFLGPKIFILMCLGALTAKFLREDKVHQNRLWDCKLYILGKDLYTRGTCSI